MIIGQHAFEIYQILIFVWFCVGISLVGFLSIRDLIRMLRDHRKKK